MLYLNDIILNQKRFTIVITNIIVIHCYIDVKNLNLTSQSKCLLYLDASASSEGGPCDRMEHRSARSWAKISSAWGDLFGHKRVG